MAKTALTPESVMMRCKVDRLESIQKMNVWGSDLEDVRVLRGMPNLEVVSLSVNKINSLKDFQFCAKMKELYLRKNLIADLAEVRYLQSMTGLKVLWLLENPCAEQPGYRLQVIKMLPSLEKLDNEAVTADERAQASTSGGEEVAHRGPQQASPARREPARPKSTENGPNRPPPNPPASGDRPNPERPAANFDRSPNERPTSSGGNQDSGQARYERATPPQQAYRPRADVRGSDGKNENLMCAVLALLKELDENSLELVRKEIERKMAAR